MYIHQLANALCERGHSVLTVQSAKVLPGAAYRVARIPIPFRLSSMFTGPRRLALGYLRERIMQKLNKVAHRVFLSAAVPALCQFRPHILIPLFMPRELYYARILRGLLGSRLVSIGH